LHEGLEEGVHLHREGGLEDEHGQEDGEDEVGVGVDDARVHLQRWRAARQQPEQHPQHQQHHRVWQTQVQALDHPPG